MDELDTKCIMLLQAHFSRLPLPITDYMMDLCSVLDQSIRIILAAGVGHHAQHPVRHHGAGADDAVSRGY